MTFSSKEVLKIEKIILKNKNKNKKQTTMKQKQNKTGSFEKLEKYNFETAMSLWALRQYLLGLNNALSVN